MLSLKAERRPPGKESGASAPSERSSQPGVSDSDVNAAKCHTLGSFRARRALVDTLIATAALAVAVTAIVVVGMLADALPPVIVTVAGVIGVGVFFVLAATRGEGR